MDTITKMVIINSTSLMPSDIITKIYESNAEITLKETCFGVMVTGERSVVNELFTNIRKMDPYGIFIKERGLNPGEKFRCRATRGGGARPGFHNLEKEDKLLPYIGSALRALDKGEVPERKKKLKKLDVDILKKIIMQETKVQS